MDDDSNNNNNENDISNIMNENLEENNISNNDSEENVNIGNLPPEHPYLRRYQISLENQLKTEEEKLRLLFKEKNNDSKKLKKNI